MPNFGHYFPQNKKFISRVFPSSVYKNTTNRQTTGRTKEGLFQPLISFVLAQRPWPELITSPSLSTSTSEASTYSRGGGMRSELDGKKCGKCGKKCGNMRSKLLGLRKIAGLSYRWSGNGQKNYKSQTKTKYSRKKLVTNYGSFQ